MVSLEPGHGSPEENSKIIQVGQKIKLTFSQGEIRHPIFGSATIAGSIPFLGTFGKHERSEMNSGKLDELISRLANQHQGLKSILDIKDQLNFTANVNPEDDLFTSEMSAVTSLVILNSVTAVNLLNLTTPITISEMNQHINFISNLFTNPDIANVDIHLAAAQPTKAYYTDLIQNLAVVSSDFKKNGQVLKQELINNFHSLALLLDSDVHEFSDKTKYLLNCHISGGLPLLECIALVKNLCISEEIQIDLLFQRLRVAFGSALYLIKDVLELKSTLAQPNPIKKSSILARIVADGVELQVAFESAMETLHKEINDVRCACLKLRECYWDDEDLAEYMLCIERIIDGQLLWYEQNAKFSEFGMHVVPI